jgi:hypothetical protein
MIAGVAESPQGFCRVKNLTSDPTQIRIERAFRIAGRFYCFYLYLQSDNPNTDVISFETPQSAE